MKALLPFAADSPAALRLGELPDPVAGPGEVLFRVRAVALNRADLLQMRGRYPPPAGESAVPGLEAAGEIVALGEGVEGWRAGERVAALLAGGGHAELVAAPAGQLLRVPASWSDEEAAALPEAAVTAWTNLVVEGRLADGESVVVSGASSGVGTFAVPLAKAIGACVIAVGRDRERIERLLPLGADAALLFDELPERLLETVPGGADVALDLVGGEHLPRLLACLAPRGRLVLVGLMAGRRAEIDLERLLRYRLELRGSVLRSRSRAEKARLVAGFAEFAHARLERRELLPTIDRTFSFERIAEAYAYLESGRPFGKVVVRV